MEPGVPEKWGRSMPSERIQRQIERLLDAADAAAERLDWATALERAQRLRERLGE